MTDLLALIPLLGLLAGAAVVGWYAWRATRASDRWPALLLASESLALALLIGILAGSAAPWWAWWPIALAAIGSLTLVAWRWPNLGPARPRWRWPNLAVNLALIAVCVGVAVISPG